MGMLKFAIKQAISEGVSAEEDPKEITERVLKVVEESRPIIRRAIEAYSDNGRQTDEIEAAVIGLFIRKEE